MSSQGAEHNRLTRRVLLALFLGACAVVLAHSVNAVVAESIVLPLHQGKVEDMAMLRELDVQASPLNSQQLVQDILSSGLFVLPQTSKDLASQRATVVPTAPPLNVMAKVSLIGTVMGVAGNEQAILEELPNKKQAFYKVSQRIPDVGELVAIEKDRVLFREGSQEEWLDLVIVKQRADMKPFPQLSQPMPDAVQPIPAQANPPGRRIVDRAQLVQLASSPQAYLNEARFQPHFAGNGKIDGFRVDGIRQVGVLENAGLQNEDVLAGVNGVEIRDPGRLWEIFKQLQHERTVRLNLVRQSQPMILTVEIR